MKPIPPCWRGLQSSAVRIRVVAGAVLVLLASTALGAPPVKHPNLLLDRQEIQQVQEKIRKHPWAADLLKRIRQDEAVFSRGSLHMAALVYALTGERSFADRVRRELLHLAAWYEKLSQTVDLAVAPETGAWDSWAAYAWAYDLTWDTFTDDERQQFERGMRAACRMVVEGDRRWTTTPNLVFGKHCNIGLMGYALGDRELIDYALNDPGKFGPRRGGFYAVLDSMIQDTYFWGETPIYALAYDVHAALALAEAALHYDGTDLYRYVSKKSGGSIKTILDGYVRMGFPVERTGLGGGSVRVVNYGDGSTNYNPLGLLNDVWLVNSPPLGAHNRIGVAGELEIAYKRYKDPAYAWLLALNPARDAYVNYGRACLGYAALTHGEADLSAATPPPAPSAIYPTQGFAFLRADETPSYWTSGAMAAVVMLGNLVGHGHKDHYSLILHGKGRLLYPDVNVIQYEWDHLGWTRDGIGHSTLLVDGQSPQPGPFSTRHDFGPEAKYFALSGSAFKDVTQSRTLVMTGQYLVDVFHASDAHGQSRTLDWVLHGLGRLYPGNPAAWRPTAALVPDYWHVARERGRTVDTAWHADWIQSSAGVRPGVQMGKEWFQHQAGVRMTMLGAPQTEVYCGDGGLVNGPPNFRIEGNAEGSAPVLVARRRVPATAFVAIHEPYERRPSLREVKRLAQTAGALALTVTGPDFVDCVLVASDDKEHTLVTSAGEAFTFAEYGYFRFAKGVAVTVRGKIKSFRIADDRLTEGGKVMVGGKPATVRHDKPFIVYGKLPETLPPAPPADAAEPAEERSAWLHLWTMPEEIRLSAQAPRAARDVQVRLRCVGQGRVQGRLRIEAPEALSVEPKQIDVPAMQEGEDRTVRLAVRAAEKATADVHTIRLVPEAGLAAPVHRLTASVGVVPRLDRRVPNDMQTLVRAPGYAVKMDHYTGFPSWIVDADGNRRYNAGTLHRRLLQLAPLEPKDRPMEEYCHAIWTSGTRFTCLTHPARTAYTFHEDRIVFSVVPPTHPHSTWVLTLANFLDLDPKTARKKSVEDRDLHYFPAEYHRQGLLVIAPRAPADYKGNGLPVKVGQEVVLKFATEDQFRAMAEEGPKP